jgi:hypothetical protein
MFAKYSVAMSRRSARGENLCHQAIDGRIKILQQLTSYLLDYARNTGYVISGLRVRNMALT